MSLKITANRAIAVAGVGKVGRIEFDRFFRGAFGASDFIAMCSQFEVIFLENVPQIGLNDSNVAKRFILFVALWMTADR